MRARISWLLISTLTASLPKVPRDRVLSYTSRQDHHCGQLCVSTNQRSSRCTECRPHNAEYRCKSQIEMSYPSITMLAEITRLVLMTFRIESFRAVARGSSQKAEWEKRGNCTIRFVVFEHFQHSRQQAGANL